MACVHLAKTGVNMDLRKMRYFCRVLEAGSISRAALSLHVAQPALSKSIQALEEDLELELFRRTTKGAIPTEAGERLYEHAQIIFNQIDRLRVDLRKSGIRPSGYVVVGMPYSIMSKLGMPLLLEAKDRFPEIRLEVTQDHSHILAEKLRSQRLDVAIMVAQRKDWMISSVPLLVEELFVLQKKSEDREPRTEISFQDASALSFVLPPFGNGLRTAVESHFRARSLPLNVKYEVDAIGLIPECVRAGLAAAILPGGCISETLRDSIDVLRFSQAGFQRTLVISQPVNTALTPAAEAIALLLRDVIRDLADRGAWLGGETIDAIQPTSDGM
jgi:DNA-binding transcriptional LysR family regulator